MVADVPGFFDAVWRLMFWVPVAWSIAVLVVAVVRGRLALARDLVAATVAVAGRGSGRGGRSSWTTGPASAICCSMSMVRRSSLPPCWSPRPRVISTASPHVSRPFRNLGNWLIALQLVGAVMLGAAVPSGGARRRSRGPARRGTRPPRPRFAGWAPDRLPHPARPRRPRTSRRRSRAGIDAARRASCCSTAPTTAARCSSRCTAEMRGTLRCWRSLWRRVWYRGVERTVRHSRVELVEHEGFVTLLGERAGVDVPRVVTAGSAGRGDALVVVRPIGETIASRLACHGHAASGDRRGGGLGSLAGGPPPPPRRDHPPPGRSRPGDRHVGGLARARRPVVGDVDRRARRRGGGSSPSACAVDPVAR